MNHHNSPGFLYFFYCLILNFLLSSLYAFSVEISDLENHRLSISYSIAGEANFDAQYLHERCFESLDKMNRYYRGFQLIQSSKSSEKTDYVLEVRLVQKENQWSIEYLLRSSWLKGQQGILYQDLFDNLDESQILLTTYKLFDELIKTLNLESSLFEHPVALIESRAGKNVLVLSDLLFEYDIDAYETENTLSQVCWDKRGELVFFTEFTERGMVLKSLRLDNFVVTEHFCSSLISSMTSSLQGEKLFFIADFTHLPHLYQLNLSNGHLKALTSGPQWVSEVASSQSLDDVLLTINRTGFFQVYEFSINKKQYKKETFTNSFSSSGKKTKDDFFYLAFDNENNLSLYQRVFSDKAKALTTGFDIHSFDIAHNDNLFALSMSQGGLKQAIALYHRKDSAVIKLESNFPRKNMMFSPVGNLYAIIKK